MLADIWLDRFKFEINPNVKPANKKATKTMLALEKTSLLKLLSPSSGFSILLLYNSIKERGQPH